MTFGMDRRFENANLADWICPDNFKNKVLDWMKKKENFLVFLGSPGTGKTYFSAAILNYFWEKGEEVCYTTAIHFIQKIQQAIQVDQNQYYIVQNFAEKDILIIDDIGIGKVSEWYVEMIFEIIDLRYNSLKPTIITSNLNFDQISEVLGARIHSRLKARENLKLEIWDKDRRFMAEIK